MNTPSDLPFSALDFACFARRKYFYAPPRIVLWRKIERLNRRFCRGQYPVWADQIDHRSAKTSAITVTTIQNTHT
jgi:hypothetical protein